DQAEAIYRDAIQRGGRVLPADDPIIASNVAGLGAVLTEMACFAEAESLLLSAEATLSHHSGDLIRNRDLARQSLVDLYEARRVIDPGRSYAERAARWRALLPAQ